MEILVFLLFRRLRNGSDFVQKNHCKISKKIKGGKVLLLIRPGIYLGISENKTGIVFIVAEKNNSD